MMVAKAKLRIHLTLVVLLTCVRLPLTIEQQVNRSRTDFNEYSQNVLHLLQQASRARKEKEKEKEKEHPPPRPPRLPLHNYMRDLRPQMIRNSGNLTVRVGHSIKNLGYVSAVHSFLDTNRSVTYDDGDLISYRFQFNLNGIPQSENVLAAELRLQVPRGRQRQNSSLNLYQLDASGKKRSVGVAPVADSLVTFDFTKIARRWRRETNLSQVLILDLEQSAPESELELEQPLWKLLNRVKPNIIVFARQRGSNGASLLAETESKPLKSPSKHKLKQKLRRSKRGSPRRAANRKRNRLCSLQKMTVEFDRLGWSDWIYAPESYQAGICVGTCTFPISDQIETTNHAVVQGLIHSMNRAVPAPCCVPTKLAPITLLYYDHEAEKATLGQFSNMIAEACGCR